MRTVLSMPRQPGKTSLEALFEETRKDDRRMRADLMAARINTIAVFVTQKRLSYMEVTELLMQEAEKIQNEAREIY